MTGFSNAPLLQLCGLAKRYPCDIQALDGVELSVRAGELVALLGANGSGKSTLLRCIARLVEPSAGTIYVGGRDLAALSGADLRRARADIAMIFQRSCLVRRRNTVNNVAAGALAQHRGLWTSVGRLPAAERSRAEALLERVGLSGLAQQRADTLSGGQAQRAAIARALAQRPRVLLADEPVASLDPDAATGVMGLLRDLVHGDGLAVLCVLHQPELAVEFADRIVVLHRGRVVADTPAATVAPKVLRALYRDDQAPS